MKKSQLKLFCVLFLALMFTNLGESKSSGLIESPFLKVISLEDGLSQLSVNGVVSAHGYLWIATDDGLNRYDGVDIKVFDSENSNLSSTTIRRVLEFNGSLYLITAQELYRFNTQKNDFEPIFSGKEESIELISLFTASNSELAIGTSNNLIITLDITTNELVKFSLERFNNDYNLYVFDGVSFNGNIWLATSQGLYKKEINDSSFRIMPNIPENIAFSSLIVDQKGVLLASLFGVHHYDFSDNSFKDIYTKKTHSSNNIFNLRKISKVGNFLYLGAFNGFLTLNLETKEVSKIALGDYSGLENPYIRSIDVIGPQLWIGTHANGMVLYQPDFPVKRYVAERNRPECMSGNDIYALNSDNEGALLFGVWGKGLHIINNSQCTLLNTKSEPVKLRANNIAAIKEFKDDYWIAYAGVGVSKIDKKLESISSYSTRTQLDNQLTLSFPDVYDITFGADNRIWFSTFSGLTLFDDMKTSKAIRMDKYGFSSEQFVTAVEVANEVWLASSSGIEIFNLKSDRVINDEPTLELKKEIKSQVNALYLQSDNLWVGTTGDGIFVIDTDSKFILKHLVGKQALPSNTVFGFTADFEGNVWASTSRGVVRINPEDFSVGRLGLTHNLQGLEFTSAISTDQSKKNIYVAGTNGLNEINVEGLKKLNEFPEPFIIEMSLNQEVISPSEYQEYTQSRSLPSTRLIELPYNKNMVDFSLAGKDFVNQNIHFRYRLLGLQKEWVDANNRKVSFAGLAPEVYTLEIQASNSLGEWPSKTKEVLLIINPPFWLTWWAKLFYFCTLMLSLFLFYLYRTKKLRERSLILESTVKKRTEELNKEKSEVERLLAYKNEEFANVSHEFRTPLTLILGPVNKLLGEIDDQKVSQKLNLVRRSSYRLLRMVDQLLFMERFRVRQESQKQLVAVHKLLKQYYESFYDLANEKGVTLSLQQLDEVWFESLPDALEKMLLNLLSNALKYTPSGGAIYLNLMHLDNNKFQVKVSDTGLGIPDDMMDKVFDRYHRVLDEQSEKITGAGIGLSLVKELAIAHGGEVILESKVNEGSTFILILPKSDFVSADDNVGAEFPLSESYQVELESLKTQVEPLQQVDTELVDLSDERQTVLLIEDNPDMRAYISETLSTNYQVITAENGQVGIEKAQESVPDLIISDIMMPVKDGLQVTEELKSDMRTSHIPVILLTARGDRESKLTGWKMKADEYLTKPFDEEELALRVQNLISIRDILRHRFGQIIEAGDDAQIEAFRSELSTADQTFIEQINNCMEEHYSSSSFNASELAKHIGLSDRQVQRKLKNMIDLSPKEMIRSYRLKKSYERLKEGVAIKATAFDCGFSSVSYFSNCFKAHFGKTPKEVQLQ
ncbi:MAG: response regulator [Gammaproteobacteria bacterium]|nr:response regulator [Gammaproteobacteria bacterium]